MKTLITLTIATLIASACATPGQMAADAEVKRLCAIDGGVRVYETVKLLPEKFNQYGSIQIPDKAKAKPTDEYYHEWNVIYYKQDNPSLRRDHFKIFRQSDGKLLGEDISYARRGGDIRGPWHDTSYRCPTAEKQSSLESKIFLKENK